MSWTPVAAQHAMDGRGRGLERSRGGWPVTPVAAGGRVHEPVSSVAARSLGESYAARCRRRTGSRAIFRAVATRCLLRSEPDQARDAGSTRGRRFRAQRPAASPLPTTGCAVWIAYGYNERTKPCLRRHNLCARIELRNRTQPSQGCDTGSNPVRGTNLPSPRGAGTSARSPARGATWGHPRSPLPCGI